MSTGGSAGSSLDGIECMRGCAVPCWCRGGGLDVGTSVMMWEERNWNLGFTWMTAVH